MQPFDHRPVLIVEDDNLCARLLRTSLRRAGIPSQGAARVDQALAALSKGDFRAVLLDLELEDGAGWPVLDKAREDEDAPPVIVLTGHGDEALAVEAIHRGAADYWSKTAVGERIVEIVEQAARRADHERMQRQGTRRQLQRRLLQQQQVADFGRLAVQGGAPERLWGQVVEHAAAALEVEVAIVVELTPPELTVRASLGFAQDHVGFRVPPGVSLAWHTLTQGQPVIVDDFYTEARFELGPLISGSQLRSALSVVVPGDREPYGVLGVGSREPQQFDELDVRVLEALAFMLGQELGRRKALRALAESKGRLDLLLDQSPLGVVEWSPEGCITKWNPAAEKIFGYSQAAALGRSWREFLPEPERTRLPSFPLGRTVGRCVAADGRIIWCEFYTHEILDPAGQVIGRVLMTRDVTNERLAEEERRAREAAEQANRLKTEFLAHMSHEIRTPLNAILGMTHLLLGTEPSVRQRGLLETIQLSGQTLLAILNDILDFSKIEAGRLELEEIEFGLDDMLEAQLALVARAAQEKGLDLILQVEPGTPAQLRGDPVRLGQVLANLLSNAVKFTSHGEVELTVKRGADDLLSFVVRDTGIGLSREQLAGLFQAFSQADSSITRQYGGTGLGLAISARLVERMGGLLKVDSRVGHGSSFEFTVPARPAGAWCPPRLDGLRAILATESEGTAASLTGLLEQLGLHVRTARSSEEVLALLGQEPPELMVVDDRLPGREELLGHRPPSTRCILLATPGAEVVEPACALVPRPCHRQRLAAAVANLVEGQSPVVTPTDAKLPPGRILVVEDNPINQVIARELLEAVGLEVEVAGNGQEAVDRLVGPAGPCPYDLVLMDLQMPILDGYAAARQLRADPRLQALPIIALTAHALAGERERCEAAGMNAYLSKPVDPPLLYAALRRWLPMATREEPAETRDLPPRAPGLDSANGLRRVAGNLPLYRSLLADFVSQHARYHQELTEALRAGELETAGRLAHTLKGLAGNLGAVEVEKAAARLEESLRQGRAPADALAEVRGALQSLAEALPGPSAHPDTDYLAPEPADGESQARLRRLLERGDAAAVELLDQAPPAVRDRIVQFDFEGALELLG